MTGKNKNEEVNRHCRKPLQIYGSTMSLEGVSVSLVIEDEKEPGSLPLGRRAGGAPRRNSSARPGSVFKIEQKLDWLRW